MAAGLADEDSRIEWHVTPSARDPVPAPALTCLSVDEVDVRRRRYGQNVLPRVARVPLWRRLFLQLFHFFAVMLWIAGGLAILAGMPQLGLAIFVVIVLNGRLSRNSSIGVPLSTSLDRAKAGAGMHVEVAARLIPTFDYFERSKRWAKADCVHTVSKLRLRVPATNGIPAEWVVESDLLRRIQRAAVTAMNASSLLIPLDERALLIEAGWPQEQAS